MPTYVVISFFFVHSEPIFLNLTPYLINTQPYGYNYKANNKV